MKKFLIGFLVILGILIGIFYREILATKDFYVFQQQNPEIMAKSTIDWERLPFTSSDNFGKTEQALNFGSLQMPIPFPATMSEGVDAAFAFGGVQSIAITRSNSSVDFFRMYNFSSEEQKTVCAFLSQTSGLGACTSNYNLYRAFLELNGSDIHAFASISDKEIYNHLITIRADYLLSKIISGFETKNIRGFLFTIDSGNYVAHLFDNQDQMYELTFTNIEQADVAFVLSNTTLAK